MRPQAFLSVRGDPRLVFHELWLVLHVLYPSIPVEVLTTTPSGAQLSIYTTSAKREFTSRVGWDWVGVGRGTKSVLQYALYFVGI